MHIPEDLRQAFTTWVLEDRHEESLGRGSDGQDAGSVEGDGAGDGPVARWSVSALLYRLWESTDTLPREVSAALGLPAGSTYGHASQMLWWLRTGHRFGCSSYAHAVQRLSELDGETFDDLYGRISAYLRANDRARARPSEQGRTGPSVKAR